MPDLAYTADVAAETAHLYEKVSRVVPPIEWPGFAPYIKAINELKRTRNAVVLAHNYMTPEISGGVTLKTVREIAATGVDLISVGALTHSPRSLDSSLEWKR